MNIGIVGCGAISGIYFEAGKRFNSLRIAACADLDTEKAAARAKEFGVESSPSVADLLARPDVEMVLNLTIPAAHASVAEAALNAGKHVYNEKPLTIELAGAIQLLDIARKNNLRVGCAPDTFLGGSHQTARRLIEEGAIGEPVAATAFMLCHGHESWHPSPAFYYQRGGGPMFDMGPYYLTALVNLLGSVRKVTASARITHPDRLITSKPLYGQHITVETPTHIAGVMDFSTGAIATIITSFDVWSHQLPCIEVYGTEGSLSIPDPNGFGGSVKLRKAASKDWEEVPLRHGYTDNSRGIGAADMAIAIKESRAHRANGELAYHVLEVMHGFLEASETGQHVAIHSRPPKPAPLPTGLADGELD